MNKICICLLSLFLLYGCMDRENEEYFDAAHKYISELPEYKSRNIFIVDYLNNFGISSDVRDSLINQKHKLFKDLKGKNQLDLACAVWDIQKYVHNNLRKKMPLFNKYNKCDKYDYIASFSPFYEGILCFEILKTEKNRPFDFDAHRGFNESTRYTFIFDSNKKIKEVLKCTIAYD